MLYVTFVRSVHANANIVSVNTEAAKASAGVVEVLTGKDVSHLIGSVPCAAAIPGLKFPKQPVLAVDAVRFVGEPVVAIVASDRYAGRDAADLVEIEYEPLPAAVDVEAAMKPDSPKVHPQFENNIAFTFPFPQKGGGDIEKAFAGAHKIVTQRLVNQRLAPIAMECRAVAAQYNAGEESITLWSSTQIPHLMRTQVAIMLGVPENRVRVIAPEVGGGFGSKLNVYREEALLAYLARKLGRPVKWAETRRENIVGTIQGRAQVNEVEVAVKKDGTVLGLRCKLIADLGAYHQLLTPAIPTLTGLMLSGPYKIPAVRMDLVGVFTNKTATDAYRGAGRPEATYVVERMMDRVAQELGMDPVAVRRKNFVKPKEFPYATATGLSYDSGNYQKALDQALENAGYEKLRKEQARLRKQGRYVGIGLSSYVEICALGPSSAMPAGGWESATVRIAPTGKVTILSGASPHGQGEETSFTQIACDRLGVSPADVVVVHGDTALVQYGIGTFGSRATAVGGTAVWMCLEQIRAKAKKFAAAMLKARPEQILVKGAIYSVKGKPKVQTTFQNIALATYTAKTLPKGETPGLEATAFFEPTNFTFPFGTHVAVVEVDGETGEIQCRRYVAVDDCGKVINPLLVDGQVQGGIAQAMGQALWEEVVYDENGQILTGSLMDYAIPRAAYLPRFETSRTETPTNVNPMGVKGVGEAGTIGCTPAIVNAVVDALSPFGVKHIEMPLRPEKVWRVIHQGRAIA
ncbi:MAG: carbon monoxide dehydrogenase [Acidobacteria bacterium]|nr:MAG: carbon monoxide dehydrogenase [Acidobacteriota bacterium]